jgi:hypothetical protein
MSLLIRMIQKVMADFALTLHMRHSVEVGGILFSFLVVQNQVVTFVAAWVYLSYYTGENKFDVSQLWTTLLVLLGLFLASILVFILLMDRKYLGTFVSTATGPQSTADKFRSATTDEQRISVLQYHPSYYAAIEGELKALLAENWAEWMVTKPEWLTESVKATIPDELLPEREVWKMRKMGIFKKKRSSLGDIFGPSFSPRSSEGGGSDQSQRGSGERNEL